MATKKWVAPRSKARQCLESIDEIKPIVGKVLVKAHNNILQFQASGTRAELLREISLEATLQDTLHDDFWRGVDARVESEIHGCQSPETQRALRTLRAKLLPFGLTLIKKSYREQAGAAELLMSRLNDEDKALLQRMETLEGTLWDWVVTAAQAALRLDELEDRREEVQLDGTDEPTGKAIQNARLQWIRAINAILSVLSSLDNVPEDVVKLFDRLARKAAKAARPAASKDAPDDDAPDDDDEPDDDDAPDDDDEPDDDENEAGGETVTAENATAKNAAAGAQDSQAGARDPSAAG